VSKRKEKIMRSKKAPRFEIEVDVRAFSLLIVTVLMCAIFVFTAFLFIRSLFGIQHFEVVGVTTYEYTDIVNASSLKRGDKLYSIDKESVEAKIMEACPYLESVKITAIFPNTVRFSLEEKSPSWYIDISGDYYVLDSDMRVMTETSSKERISAFGACELVLPNIKSAMRGSVPRFGENEQEIQKTLEIISTVRQSTFKARITKLDLTSRFEIYMTVDGVYEVYMGDMSNFEAKLETVKKIVSSDNVKDYAGGEINASDPTAVSFKPIYNQNVIE
jgi:cell division septal protein FtsQ